MKRALLVGVLALALAGVAAARPDTVLRFTTVVHDAKPVGSDEPWWGALKIGEVQAVVVPDATQMTFWYFAFPKAAESRFDAVDWDTHFVFAAVTKQRTSGYRLTIRRVTLQRISRSRRQLCVIASLERPRQGEPVVARTFFSAHAVAMPSARFRIDEFHWAIPTRFVLRSTSGALLTTSRTGGSLNREFVNAAPRLCTLRSRNADELLGP